MSSSTVGQLRKQLETLTDDTPILLEGGDHSFYIGCVETRYVIKVGRDCFEESDETLIQPDTKRINALIIS